MNEFCQCLRCDWRWVTRKVELPRQCPRCRSFKWQTPRSTAPRAPLKMGKPGAPSKYGWTDLEIGQEVVIPWFNMPDGGRDAYKIAGIHRALSNFQRRSGKKFVREGTSPGLRVTRVQ